MNERPVVVQIQSHVLPERLDNILRMWIPDKTVHLPELPSEMVRGRVIVSRPIVLRLVEQVVCVQGLFVQFHRAHAPKLSDAVLAQHLWIKKVSRS